MKESEILRFLRDNACVSGEAISAALGVSRTAVWKRIKTLRKAGYRIEGSPKMGYRLRSGKTPFNGMEIALALKTDFTGRNLFFYPSMESTNSRAMELAKLGSPEGTAVVADSQSGGRGRLGRRWFSPAGVNIYTSIVLRPAVPPDGIRVMTLLSSVALAGALKPYADIEVKWPNDILIEGKKAAGTLCEMSSEADRINHVIVGMGINVNMPASDLPADLRGIATSLREKTGHPMDRTAVVASLYSELEKWYKIFLKEGPGPVVEAWRGYFRREGKEITVKGRGELKGVCLGVDEEGALILRDRAGKTLKITYGDLLSF